MRIVKRNSKTIEPICLHKVGKHVDVHSKKEKTNNSKEEIISQKPDMINLNNSLRIITRSD